MRSPVFKDCKDIERVDFNKINILPVFYLKNSGKTGVIFPRNSYPIALNKILAGFPNVQFQQHGCCPW